MHSRGFTVVELLIVIVVIGILAALVLNSFSGAQSRARDAQRVTDVKAISTQLEIYYNGAGGSTYPDVNTTPVSTTFGQTFITTNFKGLDPNALIEPGSSLTYDYQNATNIGGGSGFSPPTSSTPASSVANNKFIYAPWNSNGTGPFLCVMQPCQHYVIFYYTEVSPNTGVQAKLSLN